jgi:N utilization substance protein A
VVSELRGEKIDIIPWSVDVARFVCNALSPAQVVKVFMDEEQRTLEVIVPDDQLSLAIGKRGQNVSLAARLTGCRIDIKGEGKTDEDADVDEFASFDGTQVEEEPEELSAEAEAEQPQPEEELAA